jgi:hypothetical protein
MSPLRSSGLNGVSAQERTQSRLHLDLIPGLIKRILVLDLHRRIGLAIVLAMASTNGVPAQQAATSGTFVLHKFAKAIGSESYAIETRGDSYVLSSHFLFTDRGRKVPLETTFIAEIRDMAPHSYSAKGKASRFFDMDDTLTVDSNNVSITRNGKKQRQTATGPWFITDGYSPVAMQEQMMRWWLAHGKPPVFNAYPLGADVRIEAAENLNIGGLVVHGCTVGGLIWGQESLWIDEAQNLIALVSTDAEFDHFEAVRQPYESSLGVFIAAAVKADLAALAKLTTTARPTRARRLAITGATLEDSTGAAPVKDSIIVIENGVITNVGPRNQVHIPNDATRLDASGKYAIPGLWDMHAHYEQVEWGPIYLAVGITGVRDVGNEFDFIRTLREELDRRENPAIGPHLEFAGIIDGTGPTSLGAVLADTPEQALLWVERYKSVGARQIKIYSSVKPEIVKAITAAAHARGLTVTGHIPDGMTAIEGVHDGMDQINHIDYELPYFMHLVRGANGKPDRSKPPILELNGARVKDLISTLQFHHTILDPTMALTEMLEHTKPLNQLEPGLDHVAPQLREALDFPPVAGDQAAVADARWQGIQAALRALHAARIPIVAGTDQAIPGYSLHRELELYVEAGFTPVEALQAATIVAARAVGVEQESGSLTVGKRADVLLLDADPLVDIHNTRAVWRTIAAGTVYDSAPLWRSVGFTP